MAFNYAAILFCLTVATGVVWIADRAVPRRGPGMYATAARGGSTPLSPKTRAWVELIAGLFPVLLVVFMVRSFVVEPFRIPSASMVPTLAIGDFILVEKFAYGLRLPIVDRKIVPIGEPERGDVVVFRYPVDSTENYVKRVIGLPGDVIVYRDKRLTINGRLVTTSPSNEAPVAASRRLVEALPRGDTVKSHDIQLDDRLVGAHGPMVRYPFEDRCIYGDGGASVTCKVPAGHYFMMGDNRDDSADSRSWGFVPEGNLLGRAVLIWMNLGDWKRIGTFG